MMFEDKNGCLLTSDEVDELSPWEIDERQLHVFNTDLIIWFYYF